MKKKKKSDSKENEKAQVSPIKPAPPEEQDEKPFDFGGLPSRDLKKNLGCG